MRRDGLVPVLGSWVRRRDHSHAIGQVIDCRHVGSVWELRVNWGGGRREWLPLEDLRSGILRGFEVQDVPLSNTRVSLGAGRVEALRVLAGREQALVQLHDTGRSVWMPYEHLRRIKSPRARYERAEIGAPDHGERFRLRVLAHALESWNEITGALDRLDVDPLPHQIHLVHRILSSCNYNWMIADDVGLGKTIEVGLLLAALTRRGQARRVLIACPSGLVRQWQDELKSRFNETYEIYGRDFFINENEHWKLHDRVIVSLDLAKRSDHLGTFRASGAWDLIVFDEAHKLTKAASGRRTDRFRLAETLRPLSNSLLLLTATPHQGKTDRFIALLELLRPDLKTSLRTLEANPGVVSEIILRNRKSQVTDAEGNFIFRGQLTHRIAIPLSPETNAFNRSLSDYLRRGYRAGETKGPGGQAVGLVMTTFRKLASSSIAAIQHALELRRARLLGELHATAGMVATDDPEHRIAEGGDDQDALEDNVVGSPAEEFFGHEIDIVQELLRRAAMVRGDDQKLKIFLEDVVAPLANEGKKLLVFTEYRGTQTYLQQALRERFPGCGEPLLINGGMSLDEKLASIAAFNGSAQFLISTEAGGEGINLHHSCHVMVNYDLPWNPSRLVQRIGRLYRYGQEQPVIVFNLHARDSFDNAAIDLMLQRVDQMVRDMAPVGADFTDRLRAEIIGELLEQVDLADILEATHDFKLERTAEDIDAALQRAREARDMQSAILNHVEGYDPNALQGTLGLTMAHVEAFARGMLPLVGISLVQDSHKGRVLQFRLPDELIGQFLEFGNRRVVRVTADRKLIRELRDVLPLDFASSFFRWLIKVAKGHKFDGYYSALAHGPRGALSAFKLRLQDDQGRPLAEEFLPVFINESGVPSVNPAFLSNWLRATAESATPPNPDPAARSEVINALHRVAEQAFAAQLTRFKHPNQLILVAAGDFVAAA